MGNWVKAHRAGSLKGASSKQQVTVEQIENRVACDLAYIENWSIWFDLRIMVLTIAREILSRHAF